VRGYFTISSSRPRTTNYSNFEPLNFWDSRLQLEEEIKMVKSDKKITRTALALYGLGTFRGVGQI
jgi:hypothetical protein